MDIIRLYDDFNVDYATSGEKHTREGWVNTPCCFCTGNEGYHLGYNLSDDYYNCFRCGFHGTVRTVAGLLSVSTHESATILQRYGINLTYAKKAPESKGKPLILPSGLSGLTPLHKKYLKGRGFDHDLLEKKWGLKSTGPMSNVAGSPYKHRIFIPYMWNGQLVTFDTRDVTGKAEEKYKACPKAREIIERKKILYGNQEAWDGTGICVEGAPDVWRFGDPSFATSGTSFTQDQVRLISRMFKTVYIVYDSTSSTSKELSAQKHARELRSELRIRRVKAEIVSLEKGDPGELSQEEADKFVKSLL